MKFQFRLKNGKTHEFTLPENVEVHRAIMWVSKGEGDEMTKFIIIPDDVESVEVIEARAHKYCPYCGTEIDKDAVFCFKCGKKTPET